MPAELLNRLTIMLCSLALGCILGEYLTKRKIEHAISHAQEDAWPRCIICGVNREQHLN